MYPQSMHSHLSNEVPPIGALYFPAVFRGRLHTPALSTDAPTLPGIA